MERNLQSTDLTIQFKPYIEEVTRILNKNESVTIKVSVLRKLARDFIRRFIQDLVTSINLDELNNITETEDIKDNLFLRRLDGLLLRKDTERGALLISTVCPFAHFFDLLRDDTFLEEYERTFKSKGFIHPLCIVHQVIREELFSRIRSGPLFTHPVLLGTRDLLTGKIAFSKKELSFFNIPEDSFKELLNNYACIFTVL